MGFTIDIDTGGTFTDGFFTLNDQVSRVKVDTTPHDFTECFMKCIEKGAKSFQISLRELLKQTDIIRFSCTIGTNALIQRKGPKLGLLTTDGYQENLYGENSSIPAFDFLLSPDMVKGVKSGIEENGEEIASLDEREIAQAVRELLEKGARVLVVSLLGSDKSSGQEEHIKKLVLKEYPRHYLGSIPVLLASEVSVAEGEYFRTNAVLTNAYLHQEMVKVLYKAEEDLRAYYFNKPLMIVHSNGGVARVAKTKALDTHNSGPVSGLMGALFMSKLYQEDNVISIDVGGTSTDVGLIQGGKVKISNEMSIENIPLKMLVYNIHGIGAGGGSIAQVDMETKELTVGPESAGALPGPACYDLGGFNPTATDALVALGYIDPDFFLGGTKKLNKEKSLEAIRMDIADIVGTSVEEAALEIHGKLAQAAARAIEDELQANGLSNHDFALFAFGGAGGMFACEIARRLQISKIYTFQQNSVFSAFGSSISDVLHIYEEKKEIRITADQKADDSQLPLLNEILDTMKKRALTDMRGEGFQAKEITHSLDLVLTNEDQSTSLLLTDAGTDFQSVSDLEPLIQAFEREAQDPGKKGSETGEILISNVRFKATAGVPHFEPTPIVPAGADPQGALKNKRPVYWGDGLVETDVYDRGRLQCGNMVQGPAIVEAEDTTYLIPEGWAYRVDQYLNGIIEEVKQDGK